MRGRYWIPKQEKLITQWERELAEIVLKRGFSLIIDSMNLNPDSVNSWKEFCKKHNVEMEIVDFTHVPLETCLKNDLKRPNSIGEKTIRETWNKYLAPSFVVFEQDKSLPKACLFDVDGTLGKVGNRSPYDGTNCYLDEANEHVVEYAQLMKSKGYTIFILSGLEDKYRSQREQQLKNYCVEYDHLIMRKTNDHRNDAIIKREFFEQFIKDKYYIHSICDDRTRVVRMWKQLGFTDKLFAVGDQDIDF
jgi:hypothetical protein